jgi:hypothetical protein
MLNYCGDCGNSLCDFLLSYVPMRYEADERGGLGGHSNAILKTKLRDEILGSYLCALETSQHNIRLDRLIIDVEQGNR